MQPSPSKASVDRAAKRTDQEESQEGQQDIGQSSGTMPNFLSASLPVMAVGALIGIGVWLFGEYMNRQQQPNTSQRNGREKSNEKRFPVQPDGHCAICRDELDSQIEILPCTHIFHRFCIREWFKTRMICPLCNLPLNDEAKSEYRRRLNLRN